MDYGAIDAVNWSTLKEILRSPLAYRHCLDNPPAETDTMILGRAVHTAVFEPDALLREYVIWEGGTRRGKAWDAFCEMHQDKTILRETDYEYTCAIRDAVRAYPPAAALLEEGQAEHTLTWTDDKTGLECKGRLDWIAIARKTLIELKTTRDIEARAFARQASNMLYHGQLAFYRAGLEANGHAGGATKIIAVENSAPYDVAVFDIGDDEIWAGEVLARKALDLLAECLEKDEWPGRYPYERALTLPDWAYPDEEEEEWMIKAAV